MHYSDYTMQLPAGRSVTGYQPQITSPQILTQQSNDYQILYDSKISPGTYKGRKHAMLFVNTSRLYEHFQHKTSAG